MKKLNELNKFEIKFILVDMLLVVCFYSYLLNTIFFNLSMISFIVALLIIGFYHLFLRKAVWNNIENQERRYLDETVES